MSKRKPRVLMAKPGLDGHDVGAKVVARALAAAGMEVVYTGLRQSPMAIARAALEEAVDVVGLSILSGAHLPLTRKVVASLAEVDAKDVLLVVGGNIPPADHDVLIEAGAAGVFPTGTHFDQIVNFIEEKVSHRE